MICLAAAGCSNERPPALVLRLFSELTIGEETNNLGVRLVADGAPLEEASYPLGEGDRAAWPQTLPIVAEGTHPKELEIALELRWAESGRPSVVVGYRAVTAAFPERGREYADVGIPRACEDKDDDGYGVGFGCDKPDCDDTDPEVPAVRFCGSAPDAGVPEVDAGRPDSGAPERDAGVPERDAGVPERDAGVRPDAGTGGSPLCGGEVCAADEECFMDRCARRCTDNRDCGAINQACLQRWGVCICRVPCDLLADCGPFMCVDGCCEIQ